MSNEIIILDTQITLRAPPPTLQLYRLQNQICNPMDRPEPISVLQHKDTLWFVLHQFYLKLIPMHVWLSTSLCKDWPEVVIYYKECSISRLKMISLVKLHQNLKG